MEINYLQILEETINLPIFNSYKLYTDIRKKFTVIRMQEIHQMLYGVQTQTEKINLIKSYVMQKVRERKEYFYYILGEDESFETSELVYRTAFGALQNGQAVSMGCAELLMLIFNMEQIPATVILRGNEQIRIVDYAVVVKDNGEVKTIDILLEQLCANNMKNYEEITENFCYMLPPAEYITHHYDITGFDIDLNNWAFEVNSKKVMGVTNIQELFGGSNEAE